MASPDDLGVAPTLLTEADAAPKGGERKTQLELRDVDESWDGDVGRGLGDAYEVTEQIGRGGMGRVLAARDKQLGRLVAVKVLARELRERSAALQRFLLEAQVGAQLEHPNIVPVYGLEVESGAPAFAMRLLGGRTFHRYLADCATQAREGRLDDEHALESRLERFLDVCNAITYAHARGVVHRDLKPENVLLGEHHEVYVVDWGVAKVLGRPDVVSAPDEGGLPEREGVTESGSISVHASTETQAGDVIGTASYMPPEQAMGRIEEHGPASDQFALGMMLQELVTLRPPRMGPHVARLGKAVTGEREPMEEVVGGGQPDPGLVAIVERATQPRPEARYPSVDAFADELRRWLRGEELSVRRDSLAQRLWRRLSRRPGVTLAVVFALLTLLAGAVAASLWSTVEAQREAAAQSERLSAMSGAVVRRSQALDQRLARVKALVEGLGARVEERLARASGDRDAAPPLPPGYAPVGWLAERGPALEHARPHARYGMDVSFVDTGYLWPPGEDEAGPRATLAALGPMSDVFRDVLLASFDAGAPHLPTGERDALLWEGQTPLHVTYAGFEDGLLVNYPGYLPFPTAYDPRRRPWYVANRETHGPRFGPPYPDASGSAILVPCNRAIRDAEGALQGVAGADMALDDLAALMRMDDLPGWRRTALLDGDLREIVDTSEQSEELGVSLHGDATVESRRVEPAVAEAVRAEGTGWVRVGNELVLFDQLEEIDWTFVARVTE
ncbi:MAG: hypothetical protein CMH59_13635 [Myxococcales bacterium]|nr:hypothetical protein [Myxococcales bacterium]